MAQAKRQSPTQQPLGFDYDEGHGEQGLAALAGISVLLQALRGLDLPRSVGRNVTVKQRQRGLEEASYLEKSVHAPGACLPDRGQMLCVPCTHAAIYINYSPATGSLEHAGSYAGAISAPTHHAYRQV